MRDGSNITTDSNSQMRLITPEELADWLKVPLSWIYDRTRRGGPERLPMYKIGRYLRFSVPEIEDYLRIKAAGSDGI
jgi:excisionase family DNA binding protein